MHLPRNWIIAPCLLLLMPVGARAGLNEGGTARLAWDTAGMINNIDTTTTRHFPLYLHLFNTPDIRELAVTVTWQHRDSSSGGYELISATEGMNCGWATDAPPGSAFDGDSTYTWTISFHPESAHSCVTYMLAGPTVGAGSPESFSLTSVFTRDSLGGLDTLALEGPATILGGSPAPVPSIHDISPSLIVGGGGLSPFLGPAVMTGSPSWSAPQPWTIRPHIK